MKKPQFKEWMRNGMIHGDFSLQWYYSDDERRHDFWEEINKMWEDEFDFEDGTILFSNTRHYLYAIDKDPRQTIPISHCTNIIDLKYKLHDFGYKYDDGTSLIQRRGDKHVQYGFAAFRLKGKVVTPVKKFNVHDLSEDENCIYSGLIVHYLRCLEAAA